jgi:pullulanase/glycogen debranching enzyme
LGVTAVELLPVHQHVDEMHLVERGLTNYWGFYEADVVKAPLRKNVLKFFGSFWP